jgi:hypothetical protein
MISAAAALLFWSAVRLFGMAIAFAIWPQLREVSTRTLARLGGFLIVGAMSLYTIAVIERM